MGLTKSFSKLTPSRYIAQTCSMVVCEPSCVHLCQMEDLFVHLPLSNTNNKYSKSCSSKQCDKFKSTFYDQIFFGNKY